ncbi:MAG: S8 family peptidase, partial [Usitatibacter sp.]
MPVFSSLALEVPTDRVIVRLKGGAPALTKSAGEREALAARLTGRTGELMRTHRVMGDGAQVMQLFRRLPAARIKQLFAHLEHDAEVIEVVPDRLFFPAVDATDPLYAWQWALSATSGINAPGAWDISTGANNLIIAIVDTGRLPHDDLAGRWIGGYDFVSLAERANDGGLRDADPADPGDWVTPAESASGTLQNCPVTDSRWHGTAMAGVIAATANNGSGIAGINWSSKLLPVRVVGKCGGYESDIADGIRWAAGIAVPGVPANADFADVLNVSLSAAGACSTTLQSAINEVLAVGTPIIVAAGNNSVDASGYSPGNCTGVITVGAVDRNGGKAGYTNFGSAVALSAPGGKSPEHFVGGDTQDNQWIFTTSNQGSTTPSANNAYTRTDFGTSIATAQVTGIASLMLSVNPTLPPQFVKEILQNTSRTFPTNTTALGSQADCTTALCGSGIVQAATAARAAVRWGSAAPQVVGGLSGTMNFSVGLRSDGLVFVWGNKASGVGGMGSAAP